MFAYVKGTLEEKSSDYIVVEAGGIGYKVYMSSSAIATIGECGNSVKIHTYYYVREDNISLYGFITKEELKLFELLLSVSGIGAKSAISMLSNITPSSFALAVITEDVKKLTELPGIGKKSAQRIILELKDKLKAQETEEDIKIEKPVLSDENTEEAVAALQILGYSKKEIEKVLSKVEISNLSTEEIIKIALKNLAR